MFKKVLLPFVLMLAVLLAACSGNGPAPVPTQTPEPTALATAAFDTSELTFADVEDGGNLTSTLEDSCECSVRNFTDFALIWLRDSKPVAVFKNMLGFLYAGVAVLPSAQAGDTIVYGPMENTLAYARYMGYYADPKAVLELAGQCDFRNNERTDFVMVNGANYDTPILYWQTGSVDPWMIKLQNNQVVEATELNSLMAEGKTSSEAEQQLIDQFGQIQGNK